MEWAEAATSEKEDDPLAILREGDSLCDPTTSLSNRHLTMIRQIDANVDNPSDQELNCAKNSTPLLTVLGVRFHPNGNLLLVGGEDKTLRFFRIDGEKNETQLSKIVFIHCN